MTQHEQPQHRQSRHKRLTEQERLQREARVACSSLVRELMFGDNDEPLDHVTVPTNRDKALLLGGVRTLQSVLQGTTDEASILRARAAVDLGHTEASSVITDYLDTQSTVEDAEASRDAYAAYSGLSAATTIFGTLTFYALFKNNFATQGIGVVGTTATIYYGAKLSAAFDVLKGCRKELHTKTRTARYIAGLAVDPASSHEPSS